MQWTSSQSTAWQTQDAFAEAADGVADQMPRPDFLGVFCSRAHQTRFAQIPGWIRERFPTAVVVGCSARGVIGGGKELESEPSFALVAASMPRAKLTPFRIPESINQMTDAEWRAAIGPSPRAILALTDSFSCDSDGLLDRMNTLYPGTPVVGGLASSASHPGANGLFLGDQFVSEGGVGVAFDGDIVVQTLVAQGCRPVGDSRRVTRAQDNLVLGVDEVRPDEWMDELTRGLSDRERQLIPRSLFVGVRRDEDWLVRTIVGYDPNSGAMTLTERVEVGDELKFFLRDAAASEADLQAELERIDKDVAGGLFFSCIGRGEGLYGVPGHDLGVIQAKLGEASLGGFFCAGEFGPVSGRNYVHGYTSALALFSDA